MTNDEVTRLRDELIRHAETCDAAAEESAINGDTSDARRDDGRASAYRHAASLLLLRAAAKGGAA